MSPPPEGHLGAQVREGTALTVDFEGWAESSLTLLGPREAGLATAWLPACDEQLERGTQLLLELLATYRMTATFFVLASTARRHPRLVLGVASAGHEIASHSMTHARFDQLDARQLRIELADSKKLLEDLVGCPVDGFRSPYLRPGCDWRRFQAEVVRAGYRYDSSLTLRAKSELCRAPCPPKVDPDPLAAPIL